MNENSSGATNGAPKSYEINIVAWNRDDKDNEITMEKFMSGELYKEGDPYITLSLEPNDRTDELFLSGKEEKEFDEK